MSSCCGQGMTNLMSQFKTTTSSFTNSSFTSQPTQTFTSSFTNKHPHSFSTQTTQITPQSFTAGGFMKYTRPTKQ